MNQTPAANVHNTTLSGGTGEEHQLAEKRTGCVRKKVIGM